MLQWLPALEGLAATRYIPPRPRSGGEPPRTSFFYPPTNKQDEQETVARTSPGEFIRQVRTETSKVVWPTRKETITTALMVMFMTALLAVFFFGVDSAFSAIVRALLSSLA